MLNTPNMLSIFRLCLVPVFVIFYFSGLDNGRLYAIGIYVLATFTDFLDGFIARKYNLITNLGKVLDPLGDKMFTFAVLACITIDKIIQPWIITLFFIKELLMGIGGIYIHKHIKAEIPPSNMLGKSATVIFFIICVVLMLLDEYIKPVWASSMIAFALIISFAALVSYAVTLSKLVKNNRG